MRAVLDRRLAGGPQGGHGRVVAVLGIQWQGSSCRGPAETRQETTRDSELKGRGEGKGNVRGRSDWCGSEMGREQGRQPRTGSGVSVNPLFRESGGSQNSRTGGEAVMGEGKAGRCRWNRGVGGEWEGDGVAGCRSGLRFSGSGVGTGFL